MGSCICKGCVHNCGSNIPIVKNKPNGICWCNVEYGRVITKKYTQCKYYESK